jgi:spoIIIJ-associated protein
MPNQNASLDVSAKTVDEAIAQGLRELGLSHDQVEIEIISEGRRGIFGLGSEEAIVRLTVKHQPVPAAPETAPPSIETIAEEETVAEEMADEDEDEFEDQIAAESRSGEPVQGRDIATIAAGYLHQLLEHMGVEADIATRLGSDLVETGEKAPLVLDVTGKDLGILIGRRSETLQALQYMVRLMVSKEVGSWQRIVVDVESYRARRRQSLRQMAQRMAERAVANQERVVMEAMSAYERRIIHVALRDHPAVFTKSIGRENNRKVTIIPK